MTVQILIANGINVIGMDYDKTRCKLARDFGATVLNLSENDDPVRFCNSLTNGLGVDGVIIAASTKSDEVIHQAAQICRKKGRITLVGLLVLI